MHILERVCKKINI
uniref:Uncharacterized protein n=1 Tax=Rhizophora mucronata TaxID=61149 RepID=A0A2P2N5P0_RHIMU